MMTPGREKEILRDVYPAKKRPDMYHYLLQMAGEVVHFSV